MSGRHSRDLWCIPSIESFWGRRLAQQVRSGSHQSGNPVGPRYSCPLTLFGCGNAHQSIGSDDVNRTGAIDQRRRFMNRLLSVALVVLFVGFAAAASAQTVRVTADRTNLRDKASTDGAIVVALSMGDELDVIDQSGTWYHVRVKSSGKEGYVSTLVVQVVPGTAPAARPAGATTPAPAPRPAPTAAPAARAAQTPAAASSGGGEGFGVGYTDVGPVIGLGGIAGAGIGFGGRFETGFKELGQRRPRNWRRHGLLQLRQHSVWANFGYSWRSSRLASR